MNYQLSTITASIVILLLTAGTTQAQSNTPQKVQQLNLQNVINMSEEDVRTLKEQIARGLIIQGAQLPPGVKPPTPPPPILLQFLRLKFDRRPQNIVKEITAEQTEQYDAVTNVTDWYRHYVNAGKWGEVKNVLANQPLIVSTQVYKFTIAMLMNPPQVQSQPQPQQNQENQQYQQRYQPQPRQQVPESHLMLPADIAGLVDACPGELYNEYITVLGAMLKKNVTRKENKTVLMEFLEKGTSRLGGTNPVNRLKAADLLITAGMTEEAAPFLPNIDEARKTVDIPILERHLVCLKQKMDAEKSAKIRNLVWDLNNWIFFENKATPEQKNNALLRILQMLPSMPEKQADAWLTAQFRENPDRGNTLLLAVAETVSQAVDSEDIVARKRNLDACSKVINALLESSGDESQNWKTPMTILMLTWVKEADRAFAAEDGGGQQSRQRYDMYGNRYFEYNYNNNQNRQDTEPLSIRDVITARPKDPWLKQVDDSVALQARIACLRLLNRDNQSDQAMDVLKTLVHRIPGSVNDIAEEFLNTWAESINPLGNRQGNRVYYGPYGPQSSNPNAIPLTRAKQNFGLKQLSNLLKQFNQILEKPIDDKVVVNAFSSCHSSAEVFNYSDVTNVMGSIESMTPPAVFELVGTMRTRLANVWREPETQQKAKTKRTDKETQEEVARGYALAMNILDQNLAVNTNDWKLRILKGALLFDLAEFEYGREVDLAIYTDMRDRAFASFEKAAELYGNQIPDMEEKDYTPLIFQFWFNATLGASDLAYLTRQHEPSLNRLEQIRASILGLPGDAAEKHMELFGNELNKSIYTLKPDMKSRYLNAGIAVLQDHPSAENARILVDFYKNLLDEIKLVLSIDGDSSVGNDREFGAFLTLRHTKEIEREAGGFGRYLMNLKSQRTVYSGYGYQSVDHRDNLEKNINDAIDKSFDIGSITFSSDKVKSHGTDEPGWRETPLAYIRLKAKDESIDRIPPIQMDVDFMDSKGQVVLPIQSQVQLIDARIDKSPVRPVNNLEITQIIDDRELKDGRLLLEIKSTGNGLIPELKDLLDMSIPGFTVSQADDQGLTVKELNSDTDAVLPIAERNWLVSLDVDPEHQADADIFHFPTSKIAGAKNIFKRYEDADLLLIQDEVVLAGVPLKPSKNWLWFAGCSVLIIAAAVYAFIAFRKRHSGDEALSAEFHVPSYLTPFTVLALLRKIYTARGAELPSGKKDELAQIITRLEKEYFSQTDEQPNEKLEEIARQWVNAAHTAKAA